MFGFIMSRVFYFLVALAILAALVLDHLGVPTPW
jgi:hypothetical protein